MIGFNILLKNLSRVEKFRNGSRTYSFFLLYTFGKHSIIPGIRLSHCVCVYVKLLNKTNICGEHEGSHGPVLHSVCVWMYTIMHSVFVYAHVYPPHWARTPACILCCTRQASMFVCVFASPDILYGRQPSWDTYGEAVFCSSY